MKRYIAIGINFKEQTVVSMPTDDCFPDSVLKGLKEHCIERAETCNTFDKVILIRDNMAVFVWHTSDYK